MSAPSAPASRAWWVSSTASAVELEPVPAMTGTRLLAAFTVSSMTRPCSLWERVADSPVVPQGTMAVLVPSETCQSTSSESFLPSTSPFLNGVTNATIEPSNIMSP